MTHRRLVSIVLGTVLGVAALVALAGSAAADVDVVPSLVYTSAQDIEQAQAILVHAGYLPAGSYRKGEVDPPTAKALREFQFVHGLRQTGVLDYETASQLPSHWMARDSDGDGVMDDRDRCPNTPAGAQVDEHGCPKDSDGDGVYDGIDLCPDTPRGARVDASGCPNDSDRDGIYDGLDQCPDTPRGAKVDSRGCPMDSDHDGVYDGLDDCPDTPRGKKVDERGCPEPEKPAAMFEGKKSLVLEGVNFETNSAKLTSDSHSVLDRVAESLNASPDVKVEVAGHTDSVGSDSHNMSLSKARAESVRDYLVKKGVDSSRLVARGYGETKPIADNGTAAGRAKNRRVELTRID
jgi:outer membrane protein OmpA-like peptidoglycan-associated protein